MDYIARDYVRLVLALGQHDPDYVDAYYGPAELRAEVAAEAAPLAAIRERAQTAREALDAAEGDPGRKASLDKQLDALLARVDHVDGRTMPFDVESQALYDVVAPHRPDSYYAEVLAELEPLLPGDGSLGTRFEATRKRFLVPPERLAAVFDAAIEAARERTKAYIPLPEEEDFRTEYVRDRVWGAYNWYEGNAKSLIQVNVDSPSTLDAAVGLACHEGYPGHHVYNALLERDLARGKGWEEFTVYPLYSPQSLIAEGTAEYGVGLCFPPDERLAFEREVLAPLAGLDPEGLEEYAEARRVMGRLKYAANDAGRRYLDGEATRAETLDWLVAYAMADPERVDRRLRFVEHNRSYIVTYNVGQDLVERYVESRATTTEERWRVFTDLLRTPQTPSGLIAAEGG